MKLSKREKKKNDEVLKLLEKENLNHYEIERVFNELNEGYLGDITANQAFFTSLDLAYDLALMSPTHGVLIDLCAGFGALSYAALIRDTDKHQIKKIICIERNLPYIEVGKKLVKTRTVEYYDRGEKKTHTTEVIWIHGDMFDKSMWDKLIREHGKYGPDRELSQNEFQFDTLISNPPFGKTAKSDTDRCWLKYTGSEIDIAAIEVSMKMARYCSFILPQGSCTFKASKVHYHQHVENRKINKLIKDTGEPFYMAWTSIDTGAYEQCFKNTQAVVECCTIYRKDEM